jgi:hypothetical protein
MPSSILFFRLWLMFIPAMDPPIKTSNGDMAKNQSLRPRGIIVTITAVKIRNGASKMLQYLKGIFLFYASLRLHLNIAEKLINKFVKFLWLFHIRKMGRIVHDDLFCIRNIPGKKIRSRQRPVRVAVTDDHQGWDFDL